MFIAWCKNKLDNEFDMMNITPMHYFLGLQVWKGTWAIFLVQGNYIVETLKRF